MIIFIQEELNFFNKNFNNKFPFRCALLRYNLVSIKMKNYKFDVIFTLFLPSIRDNNFDLHSFFIIIEFCIIHYNNIVKIKTIFKIIKFSSMKIY